MHFYATAIYLKYNKIPEAKLIWIETEAGEGGVKPTGHVEEFPVKFTLGDMLYMMGYITRVAKEIEIAYAAHVPDPAILNY